MGVTNYLQKIPVKSYSVYIKIITLFLFLPKKSMVFWNANSTGGGGGGVCYIQISGVIRIPKDMGS